MVPIRNLLLHIHLLLHLQILHLLLILNLHLHTLVPILILLFGDEVSQLLQSDLVEGVAGPAAETPTLNFLGEQLSVGELFLEVLSEDLLRLQHKHLVLSEVVSNLRVDDALDEVSRPMDEFLARRDETAQESGFEQMIDELLAAGGQRAESVAHFFLLLQNELGEFLAKEVAGGVHLFEVLQKRVFLVPKGRKDVLPFVVFVDDDLGRALLRVLFLQPQLSICQ